MDISFVVPGEERKNNECQESSDPPGEKGTPESRTPKGTGRRSQKGSRAGQNGRKDIGSLHYDQFGFRDKRLMRMLKQIDQEALKFDQEATRFNLEFYAGRLQERIQAAQIRPKVESLTETIYGSVRDEYFISSGAVMFMVLNEYFGFASNNKGTGRTDLIMAYMVNEYIKVNLDPEGHDVEFYYRRMKDKTGLDI